MGELKYFYLRKITERQTINLMSKLFRLVVQAYMQKTEKSLLSIWKELSKTKNVTINDKPIPSVSMPNNNANRQNQNQSLSRLKKGQPNRTGNQQFRSAHFNKSFQKIQLFNRNK